MTNEIVSTQMANDMELSKIFAESGIFPDIKSAAQGYVKVLAGRELGLSPMQSINSFYFVNGKLGIAAQTMGALVKKSGKYDYKIISHSTEECTLEFFKIGNPPDVLGRSTFDLKMAAKAGIVNGTAWKNYPMNMLLARALMNGIRWMCPDAVSAFLYSIEELQDLEPEKKESTVTITTDGEVSNGT